MSEDVNARIVVDVESKNAEQGISRVKQGLSGITDARTRDLQIAQAKSRLELADYKMQIAAEKAYKAQIQMTALEKLKAVYARKKNKKDLKQVSEAIERNRKKLLELNEAETTANLKAHEAKLAYDNLTKSFKNNASGADDLIKKRAGLRALGKLLKTNLGSGASGMAQVGIIAAGAAAAVKLIGFAYDFSRKSMREYAEDLESYSEIQQEITERVQERIQREENAIQTVENLAGKENRSIEETIKLSSAIRMLGGDFEKLAEKSNLAAGGVADFSKISDAARLKHIEDQRRALKAELNDLKGERDQQTEIRDTAGVPIWFGGNVRVGGEQEILRAQDKLKRISEKQLEINKKLHELRKKEEQLKIEAEEREKLKAEAEEKAYSDAQSAMENRIGTLNKQREIQELTNKGLLREAELLRVNMKLDQERAKLTGPQAVVFDEQRQNLLESEMALFDEREKKATKNSEKRRDNLLSSMAKDFFQYRATTQGAVSADSVEGLRLQSRIFTNTPNDPAKQSASHLKTIENQNKTIVSAVQTLSRLVSSISGNGIKLSGVATRKYS